MRRSLDAAKSDLASLGDRDAILAHFFEYTRTLFKFGVLFVVRGDVAHGRDVHGLGAPPGLVTRLSFSLDQPGLLMRAKEVRKPFVGTPATDGADAMLVGSLGRAMHSALVAPLVVRDRLVAILLAEGPSDALSERARMSGRAPMDVAREEMLVWTSSIGDAFERLIVRRKAGDGAAALLGPAELPQGLPHRASARPPAPTPLPAPAPASAPAKLRWVAGASVAAVLTLTAAGLGLWLGRSEPGPDAIAVVGAQLTGWPRLEPVSVLQEARRVADVGSRGELLALQADVATGGLADLSRPDALPISVVLATTDTEAEVRIDGKGMHGAHKQPRARCGDQACRSAVPPPKCTFAQIWESARSAGRFDNDRVTINYAAGGVTGAEAAPEWFLAIVGRGTVRFDAVTCKPLPRQRLRPPPLPLSAIPNGPEVDPVAIVPLARTQSGLENDAVLFEIEARGVGSNGHVDLRVPDRNVVYTFADPDTVPAAQRRWRQVTLGSEGMPITSTEFDREPMPIRFRGAIPLPRCTFARAWSLVGKVPNDVTAHAVYGRGLSTTDGAYWSIDVASMGLAQTASDRVCADWEKLQEKHQK